MTVYPIIKGICRLVSLLQRIFEVLAGREKVSYEGDGQFLLEVLFSNRLVTRLYLVMALLGIVLCLGFFAGNALGKGFLGKKKKAEGAQPLKSLAGLFGELGRSILMILAMSLCVTLLFETTSLILEQTHYLYAGGSKASSETTVTFTPEQYGAMARAMQAIGNASLAASPENAYNLADCFEKIRPELAFLEQEGVFDLIYPTQDPEGNPVYCWQASLKKIAAAADPGKSLSAGDVSEALEKAMVSTMKLLKNDLSYAPLEELTVRGKLSDAPDLGSVAFLSGSMNAAHNARFNEKASLTDALRGAYLTGSRSVYSAEDLEEDFDLSIRGMEYLPVLFCAGLLLWELGSVILMTALLLLRIVLLYLSAPVVFGAGEKGRRERIRSYLASFLLHSGIACAAILMMRGVLFLAEVIMNGRLFGPAYGSADAIAKVVLLAVTMEAVKALVRLMKKKIPENAKLGSVLPEKLRKLEMPILRKRKEENP